LGINHVIKTSVKDALGNDELLNQEVELSGWVRSRRSSKGGFSFIHINDGSCFDNIQAVADEKLANYGDILELSSGFSVRLAGKVVESGGKGQDREIQASQLSIVGAVEDPENYPISKKQHSFEYLRTMAHLRPRTNTFGAMTRVRHAISHAVHEYFNSNGFFWVNTPIITSSDCEGAGELFKVSTLDTLNRESATNPEDDFFGTSTFLTVSGQLNVESYACALSKVYTFGPTFRAENSNTSRHLAEFWMIEPEIAFADLLANAELAENFLKAVVSKIMANCEKDIEFFNERVDPNLIEKLQALVEKKFTLMSYSDAIEVLQKSGSEFEFPVSWGNDLQSEHERFLTENITSGPVVVTDYPKDIKAFYMRLNDDEKTVAAMDVLVPGVGELIGGSQREERLEVLDSRMDEHLREELWWYRELRKYGTVPHAGFGLGFERLVLYLTGMENVRDAIPFPRTPKNVSF
tara:strand:+ start:7285 stop:8679 length:1395 start_codon:yes stop_codon:yes gene_type:complete